MAITRIITPSITDDAVDNTKLDLASNYAFTGTVSGANGANAWVNFNGTGTVAIRDSYNVSSITDVGTGNYRINFTNTMTNNTYTVFGSCNGGNYDAVTVQDLSTSSVELWVWSVSVGAVDQTEVFGVVIGDS